MSANIVKGRIKFYNTAKQFGFITPEMENEIFFHYSGDITPRTGDGCYCWPERTVKGYKTQNILLERELDPESKIVVLQTGYNRFEETIIDIPEGYYIGISETENTQVIKSEETGIKYTIISDYYNRFGFSKFYREIQKGKIYSYKVKIYNYELNPFDKVSYVIHNNEKYLLDFSTKLNDCINEYNQQVAAEAAIVEKKTKVFIKEFHINEDSSNGIKIYAHQQINDGMYDTIYLARKDVTYTDEDYSSWIDCSDEEEIFSYKIKKLIKELNEVQYNKISHDRGDDIIKLHSFKINNTNYVMESNY